VSSRHEPQDGTLDRGALGEPVVGEQEHRNHAEQRVGEGAAHAHELLGLRHADRLLQPVLHHRAGLGDAAQQERPQRRQLDLLDPRAQRCHLLR
jgi:hypothetical protein